MPSVRPRIRALLFAALCAGGMLESATAAMTRVGSREESRAPELWYDIAPIAQFEGVAGIASAGSCGPRSQDGVLHGLLVALGYPTSRFRLPGPANDAALLRQSLTTRGGSRARVTTLSDQTSRAAMLETMAETLACVREGDQVLFYFGGHSARPSDAEWAASNRCPKDSPVPCDQQKPELPLLPGTDDVLLIGELTETGTPAIDRAASLSGIEVANFVTAVRNRGADALVILDTNYARRAAIARRQALAAGWSAEMAALDKAAVLTPSESSALARLKPSAGGYAVFYATDVDEPAFEGRFTGPDGTPLHFGVLSYGIGMGLQTQSAPSVADLARTITDILGRNASDARKHFGFVEASSPDLRVLSPAAPVASGGSAIEIIRPQTTRGVIRVKEPEVSVVARFAAGEPRLALIDNVTVPLDSNGQFSRKVPVRAGQLEIPVAVLDQSNRFHQRLLSLDTVQTVEAVRQTGRRYALVIGNARYSDPAYPALRTPHNDARVVAQLLRERFGFATEILDGQGKAHDLLRFDLSAGEILDELDLLSQRLTEDDTLLIYYAGHGILQNSTGMAFWVGADAKYGRSRDLVAADDIRRALMGIKAGNVLVVADSCYSGELLRAAAPEAAESGATREQVLLKSVRKTKRILISSGGTEPVLDGGGGDHSVFARAFIDGLTAMEGPAFAARELFTKHLHPRVAGRADQEPQMGFIRNSGHQEGDFVFFADGPKSTQTGSRALP